MLAEVEKNTKTAIGYITDAKAKAAAEAVAEASIEFAKAQNAAVKAYADAVRKAIAI
jgi:ABC-type phosphate transport system substrate-binding protein